MTQPKLQILIVGAGIAGLAASIGLAKSGHKITILESAHALSPVGGGIHVPPNATLVLQRWKILHRFEHIAIVPEGFTLRRYANSNILAKVAVSDEEATTRLTPYWSVRRSDYQQILFDIATELGVDIKLGQRVQSIDFQQPSVRVDSGKDFTADLVVIADGMKSKLRQQLLPNDDVSPILQPYETYRAIAPASIFANDEETKKLFATPTANVWMGENRHVIIYPAENGKMLSVNGTHAARNESAADWNKPASTEQIQHSFRDFDPLVRKVLQEVRDCKAWALAEVPRLSRWTSASGNVVMMGDAAHGMLQFLAQGGAMAMEDAGALVESVSRIKSAGDIPAAMRAFERARKWRCEKVQAQARRNGDFVHVPDGVEQEHRDRKLAGLPLPDDQEVDTGPLVDAEFRRWLYYHDVFEHTRKYLDEAGL